MRAVREISRQSVRSQLARQIAYRPLLVLAVGLALGIVAEDRLGWPWSPALVTFCLALGALGLALGKITRALRLFLAVPFFALGILLHSHHYTLPPSHLKHFLPLDQVEIVGRVVEPVTSRPSGRRVIVDVEAIRKTGPWRPVTGRVALFEPGWAVPLRAGERLHAEVTRLEAPPAPANPGQFDARRFYAQRRLCGRGTLRSASVLPGQPRCSERLVELVAQRQRQAAALLTRAMPGPRPEFYAGLMGGMVFGQRAAGHVDEAAEDLFRRTGTVHLLVVSGAQVTFIVLTMVLLVTGKGRRALAPWHLLLLAPPMVAFALFSGLEGSVARALVMAAILSYAMVTHRDYDPYSALALAALALALSDTWTVFDVGTQLTFAASLGVILFVPRALPDRLTGGRRKPSLLRTVFWGTVGAWAMTTPLVVANFHGLPLLGNLANLVAIPLSLVILPLGMLALLTASWLLPVTVALCAACRVLIAVMLQVNALFRALPLAYVDVVHFGPAANLAWYLLVAGGLLVLARADLRRPLARALRCQSRDRLCLAAGTGAAGLVLALAWQWAQPPRLTVTVLAVGEGNCVLVQSPAGRTLMMDAGSSAPPTSWNLAEDVIIPFLACRGVRRLDAFLLTHPDADHCNAAEALLARVSVRQFLDPLLPADTHTYDSLREALQARQIPVVQIRAGQVLDLGGGVTALLVAPSEPLLTDTGSDLNNNSAALLVQYGATRILLMGDQEEAGLERVQTWAQAHGVPLQAQVLLLPHHGRAARWCGPLLRQTGAHRLLVSGGQADSARAYLGNSGRVLSTAESGALTVVSDGQRVQVNAYRRRTQ